MAGPNAPWSASAAQEKNAAVVRSGRGVLARVKNSGYFANWWLVNALSTTPCLSGHTPVAMDDHPGPESVRDLMTRLEETWSEAALLEEISPEVAAPSPEAAVPSGTISPGDSVRGAAASPYGRQIGREHVWN